MPYRVTPLVAGQHYHILNRGVAYQPTFSLKRDYERFLLCLSYYQYKDPPIRLSRLLQIPKAEHDQILKRLEHENNKIVELIAYCLMPNHFHLLLKQVSNDGISQIMKRITDSYTRFYNTKYERVGPLFQGAFKAIHISTEEQLLHLSRYIHLNPLVSFVVRDKDYLAYPWSSLHDYLNGNNSSFVNPQSITQHFTSSKKYLEFIMDQADYGKRLEQIKHLTLEK